METGSGPLLELHIKAAHDNPMPELKCRKCEFREGRRIFSPSQNWQMFLKYTFLHIVMTQT